MLRKNIDPCTWCYPYQMHDGTQDYLMRKYEVCTGSELSKLQVPRSITKCMMELSNA